MAKDERPLILDAAGEPIGRYRYNQDPEDPQRAHPVPRLDAAGEPVILRIPQVDDNGDVVLDSDGKPVIAHEQPEVDLVPIGNARAQRQLAADGLTQDPDAPHVLVATDTSEVVSNDPQPVG